MTPRADALSQLRARLLTVVPIAGNWQPYAVNRIYNAEDSPFTKGARFIEDGPLGEDSTDSALGGPSVRWRRTDGIYQATLAFPVDVDMVEVLGVVDLIEAAFLAYAQPSLPDGTPITIRDVRRGTLRPPSLDSFARISLQLTYFFMSHT